MRVRKDGPQAGAPGLSGLSVVLHSALTGSTSVAAAHYQEYNFLAQWGETKLP